MKDGIFGSRDAQCEVCRVIYRKGELCPNRHNHSATSSEAPKDLEKEEKKESSEGSGSEQAEVKTPKRGKK